MLISKKLKKSFSSLAAGKNLRDSLPSATGFHTGARSYAVYQRKRRGTLSILTVYFYKSKKKIQEKKTKIQNLKYKARV